MSVYSTTKTTNFLTYYTNKDININLPPTTKATPSHQFTKQVSPGWETFLVVRSKVRFITVGIDTNRILTNLRLTDKRHVRKGPTWSSQAHNLFVGHGVGRRWSFYERRIYGILRFPYCHRLLLNLADIRRREVRPSFRDFKCFVIPSWESTCLTTKPKITWFWIFR